MVTCKVCGKELLFINASHLKKHGMTVAEYKIKFDSNLTDPSIGEKVSKKNKGRITKTKGSGCCHRRASFDRSGSSGSCGLRARCQGEPEKTGPTRLQEGAFEA